MHLSANALNVGVALGGLLGIVGQGQIAFVVLLIAGILSLAGL